MDLEGLYKDVLAGFNAPSPTTSMASASSARFRPLPTPPDHDSVYHAGPSVPAHPPPSRADTDDTALVRSPAAFGIAAPDASDDDDHDDDDDDDYWEPGDDELVDYSLLSHIAVQLRDRMPRGTHVKGSIPYPGAFTGKDVVSTIHSLIHDALAAHGIATADRRPALQIARSLQSQLFFYEVEWGGRVLQDGLEDVYMFLDDPQAPAPGPASSPQHTHDPAVVEKEELPTGIVTVLTRCYSVMCEGAQPCYSWSCPYRQNSSLSLVLPPEQPQRETRQEWPKIVEKEVLERLPQSEIRRQTIIHKIISKEEDYVQDLDTIESLFIRPLQRSPVLPPATRAAFIHTVFSNALALRAANRALLDALYVRQREQAPVIARVGDVFLDAAARFAACYPEYVARLPAAEKRLKDEMDANSELRLFLEEAYRHMARTQQSRCLNLKHFLTRPSEHLQKYPVLLDAVRTETDAGNPDAALLAAAAGALRALQGRAQLRTWQCAMGRGPTEKWEWADLVGEDARAGMGKKEVKRQNIIFELIKGEMDYVRDLELIEPIFIQPLRDADPPIVPRARLPAFLHDVFHNYTALLAHHRRLLAALHAAQAEEHPAVRSVTAPLFDAALNWREAYLEYVANYPVAEWRLDEELAGNEAFKQFVEDCRKHPDTHRLPLKHFIYRPIPRLLRYDLLLKGVLAETPAGAEDARAIPQALEVLRALGREAEPGVQGARQKVELWRAAGALAWKPGEAIDMDLFDESRSLIHTGKLLRPPETGFDLNGWTELFVLLFDNYLVMTKMREKDGVTKYHVNRRPIPLDLLTLTSFTDPPTQRGIGINLLRTRGGGGGDRHADAPAASGGASVLSGVSGAPTLTPASTFASSADGAASPAAGSPEGAAADGARLVYPLTLHHTGRLGGAHVLYADGAGARAEWRARLEEAVGLRRAVQENNRVFEVETLSADTFAVPAGAGAGGAPAPAWSQENSFTGRVTCSVPFTTADGRGLVAIGCAEGVWIGFRHDSRSMRRVLHLKQVTQCAMLSDFGIFLVLADKSLFAYHIEALVPSTPGGTHNTTPQKLSGTRDVHFFSVGMLHGRTLVTYMKKRGMDSIFRVLEPVMDKITEKTKATPSFSSRIGLRQPRSEWFRVYRDFFLPSESFDLIFWKAKIAILCTKGFEIMDLSDFKSVTIPLREDPRLEKLAKRCESCRPIGMFRASEEEFLLCYDEFGLYVNKHGDPTRTGTIEWEGTADRAAVHGRYVLLFDTRFIEVRHVDTGRLAQIIPGSEVRCIWDGRGVTGGAGAGGGAAHGLASPPAQDDAAGGQEPRVHAVMNLPEPAGRGGGGGAPRAVTQHVFELVPTVPLYLPGAMNSPASAAAYFPPSASPPQSPRLSPQHAAWR